MKRCGLDCITLATVLLTAFVLTKAGWFSAARSATPRRAEVRVPARPTDAYSTDAALRFRRCQANHWRACVLQH